MQLATILILEITQRLEVGKHTTSIIVNHHVVKLIYKFTMIKNIKHIVDIIIVILNCCLETIRVLYHNKQC